MVYYELKWPKLSVVTFELSAAHHSLEVRQLDKWPGSQPRHPVGICWAPNGQMWALCPSVLAAKAPVSQCLPPRKHFSVSGEDATAGSVPFVTCSLPEAARLGRSVFSSGGEAAESAAVLFGKGGKAQVLDRFSGKGQWLQVAAMWRGRVISTLRLFPAVWGQQAPSCLMSNLAVIYCNCTQL